MGMVRKYQNYWNSAIRNLVQGGQCSKALELCCNLLSHGFKPDNFTFPYILKASSQFQHPTMGLLFHNYSIKDGFDSNLFVINALILFYGQIGELGIARHLFDKSPQRDVVTWTTIISEYARSNQFGQAIELFRKMQVAGTKPNSFTVATILPILFSSEEQLQIHAFLVKNGYESDIFVSTVLIDAYSKYSKTHYARVLFDGIPQRTVISWNAMITGYSQNGSAQRALELFAKMQSSARIQPDVFTIVAILSSCADLASLRQGKEMHGYVYRLGFWESNIFVGNGLIHMYGKCGNIETASRVFDNMVKRDVGSWTSLITCYGSHGHGTEAISIFEKMKQAKVRPNSVTFTAVLSACSHSCLLKDGSHYFYTIPIEFNIEPTVKHYVCMVDMMGRAGLLKEALQFIQSMPIRPDFQVWEALLGASSIHGDAEIAETAVKFLLEFEPENSEVFVQLSNVYAKVGHWDEVANIRERMRRKRVQKFPGSSWIRIEEN